MGRPLYEQSERPFLEVVKFSLALVTAFDHQSTLRRRYLLNHYLPGITTNAASNKTRKLVYSGFKGDYLLGWFAPRRMSARILVGRNGSTGAEENRPRVGFWPLA
jgi:hypothetical protein